MELGDATLATTSSASVATAVATATAKLPAGTRGLGHVGGLPRPSQASAATFAAADPCTAEPAATTEGTRCT